MKLSLRIPICSGRKIRYNPKRNDRSFKIANGEHIDPERVPRNIYWDCYKEKPVGRVDDPFLIDKMWGEKEGILLWALEGLHRLIRNSYQFTISERTAANLKEAMEQGNNILGFLKSEGYFEIRQGAKCKSTNFYKVYERWCLDNLEKPLAASTFIHHLKDNQKSLGIVYDDKCIGTNRGFHNVDVDLFLPVDVPSPWD